MCPACLSTTATVLIGAASASGVAALVARTLGVGLRITRRDAAPRPTGDDHAAADDRDA